MDVKEQSWWQEWLQRMETVDRKEFIRRLADQPTDHRIQIEDYCLSLDTEQKVQFIKAFKFYSRFAFIFIMFPIALVIILVITFYFLLNIVNSYHYK